MSNALIHETSPYLLSHANDPVDWYPWGEAAFEKARREDKPVFLSIGYSTCHWCHVMAQESFRDGETAALLNRYYIAVKVDREERPDVDSVYMSACIALNGSGGWPLTVVMTPQQQPFFVSTYIPRGSGAHPGLLKLLGVIADKWAHDRAALYKTSGDVCAYLTRSGGAGAVSAPGREFAARAAARLSAAFDAEYGGFGPAPKFPMPQNLIFLMRYAALSGDKAARAVAEDTLKAMYKGGIFDHFGGGYFCAQDADSGGEEGAYYLFTPDEVKKVLGEDAGRHFCECYDITAEGNFRGKSIPNLLLNTRWNLLPEGYDDFREELRMYRSARMELNTDKKILTAANGLMLMALSRAARAFSDARYLAAARELAAFMEASLFRDGALMACLCGGVLKLPAQLDDLVFYALGLTELYAADYDPAHILAAQRLAREVTAHFSDGNGAYYRTADTAEKLITRPLEIIDGALPSGSSGAAVLFDALFRLTGDVSMRQARDGLLSRICGYTEKVPEASAFALCALLSAVYPAKEILCAAPDEAVPELLKAVTARYSPELTVLLKSPARAGALAAAAPFTDSAQPKDGKAAFYICENGACREGVAL